jgi:DNA-binding MarR family transcriptional regulator
MSLDIQSIMDQMLKPYNLTMEQLWVLRCLSDKNPQFTQSEICLKTSKTPANLSRILNRLENKSFVLRLPNPSDRRAHIVVLTDRGRSLLQEVDVIVEYFSAKFSSGIDAQTWETMRRAMNIMNDNLSGISKIFLIKKEEASRKSSQERIIE